MDEKYVESVRDLSDVIDKCLYSHGQNTLSSVDYDFQDGDDYCWIELLVWRKDTATGDWGYGRGGKRYLDKDELTPDKVVQAIFGAYMAYEEHECREAFLYDGHRVYGPHMKLDALVTAAQLSLEE